MKVSLLLAVIGLIAVIGCSESKAQESADEPKEDSADVVSEASESETSAEKEASSDGAASPAGDPGSTSSAGAAPASRPGAPAPPATASPGGGANPAPAQPAAAGESCYARCLAPKGQRVNAFDACMTKCGDGDGACVDACWTASGCVANETECEQAYRTCDAQCPDA